MAWSDEPTHGQISALYGMLQWHMSTGLAMAACNYAKEHGTRKDVSDELGRIRSLYINRTLSKETAFDSAFWDWFRSEEES